MHTTKKKRKYGKKRTAAEAELDEKEDHEESASPVPDVSTKTLLSNAQRSHLKETEHKRTQQHQPIPSSVQEPQYDGAVFQPHPPQQQAQSDHQQNYPDQDHRYHQQQHHPHQQAPMHHQPTQYQPLQTDHHEFRQQGHVDHRLNDMAAQMPPQADMSAQLELMFEHQMQGYNHPQDPSIQGQPLYENGQPMSDHAGFQVLQSNGHLDPKHHSDDPISAHPGMDQVAHHLAQSQANGQHGVQLPHEFSFGPIQDLRQQ